MNDILTRDEAVNVVARTLTIGCPDVTVCSPCAAKAAEILDAINYDDLFQLAERDPGPDPTDTLPTMEALLNLVEAPSPERCAICGYRAEALHHRHTAIDGFHYFSAPSL